MTKVVNRGFSPKDTIEFGEKWLPILQKACEDSFYLLNRGYRIKGVSTFVGNHYMISERQRLAMVRSVSSEVSLQNRSSKEVMGDLEGQTVHIDGFNTIITLEVALSDSLVLKCMDGCYRDLAGLRGNYRVIDKTERAIGLIGDELANLKVGKVIFYIDEAVSNSGRLKEKIFEVLSNYPFEVDVNVLPQVDSVLEKLENVISSDAIILDRCVSWLNLNKRIIERVGAGFIVELFGINCSASQ